MSETSEIVAGVSGYGAAAAGLVVAAGSAAENPAPRVVGFGDALSALTTSDSVTEAVNRVGHIAEVVPPVYWAAAALLGGLAVGLGVTVRKVVSHLRSPRS